jgi:SAM-dependent methyltransferase
LSRAIASQYPQCKIVGIDPSGEFIAYAAGHAANANVQFVTSNAQQLSFPNAKFDACLSLLVFNFIPDPMKALAELQRVTRPGGKICAATWDYADGMQMLRLFWDAATHLDADAQQVDEKNMSLCRSGELTTLWRQGGLVNVEEEALQIKMKFSSFDDFWQPFLLGRGPAGKYVQQLTPARRAVLHDHVKGLLPQQGAFELSGRAWAVRGNVS